jgi:hypothetical protein
VFVHPTTEKLLKIQSTAVPPPLIVNTLAHWALYAAPDRMSFPLAAVKGKPSLQLPKTAKLESGMATEKLAM